MELLEAAARGVSSAAYIVARRAQEVGTVASGNQSPLAAYESEIDTRVNGSYRMIRSYYLEGTRYAFV